MVFLICARADHSLLFAALCALRRAAPLDSERRATGALENLGQEGFENFPIRRALPYLYFPWPPTTSPAGRGDTNSH